jgi:hypothetical protein
MFNFIKYTLICLCLFIKISYSQVNDTLTLRKKRQQFWLTYGTLYTVSITGLYFAWYDSYNNSKFHWFDDSGEWLQMDKFGHAFTAFQLNKNTYNALKQLGYNKNQTFFYSAISSFLLMNTIEIFDGFSEKWGASYSDIAFNAIGTSFFSVQQLIFDKVPVKLKFSFHYTPLSNIRPEALGGKPWDKVLKDYNGQTYWLSININDFFPNFKPKWFNIAFGYGAYNMIYAREYEQLANKENLSLSELKYNEKHYRKFFLSFDISPHKINTKCRWLNKSFKVFSAIKLPFPAIEFNKHRIVNHIIYF